MYICADQKEEIEIFQSKGVQCCSKIMESGGEKKTWNELVRERQMDT